MARSVTRRTVVAGGVAAGAAVGLSLGRPAAGRTGGQPANLALTGVTVVDPRSSRPRPDMTVLISGERIVRVERTRARSWPKGTRVVHLPGKFLIPGLCEMHAHSVGTEKISPPLYVANGVTTVREMAASAVVSSWRDKIETGQLLGPRWIIAGSIIDGYPSLLLGPGEEPEGVIPVRSPAEARNAVRLVKRQGADFVKIYSRLSRESFAAVALESRRQGLRFLGHLPDLVRPPEAIAQGQHTIEHLQTLALAASTRQLEVRNSLSRLSIKPGDYASWFRQIHPIEWMAATSPGRREQRELFDRLARASTWVTPTLTMHQIADRPEDVALDDERLRYIPADTQEFWNYVLGDYYKAGRTPAEIAQQRQLYEHRLRFVKAMHDAGVRLLAGSEAGFVYSYPGFTLHDELIQLVQAGLSPLQALRTATVEPAESLGLDREIGAIRPHHVADLVVLDANPLADIASTRRIHAVVVRGQFVDSHQRSRLLTGVAEAAGSPSAKSLPAAPGCFCHLPRNARPR